jgi:hypothetical protein
MRTKRLTRGMPLAGAVAAALLISLGCAGNMPTQTRLMKQVGGIELTSSELHDLTYEYSKFFALEVESAADRIREESDDDEVRYNALLWKSYGIPAMQRAALQRDPLAAMIDLWALNLQMRNYFTDGTGRDLFAEQQPIALETCDELDRVLMVIVRWAQPVRDSTRQDSVFAAFARANPMDNPLFTRASTRPLLIDMTSQEIKGGLGGVAQMSQSVAAINDRLEVYTESLPKQIRWQTEMVLEDYVRKEQIPRLMNSVASIDSSAISIAGFLGGVEDIIARERALVLEEVNRSLEGAYAVIDQERAAVIEDVDRQREIILADVSVLASEKLDHATGNVNELVDRIFAKLVVLLAGFVISILVVGAILIVLARLLRRPASPVEA